MAKWLQDKAIVETLFGPSLHVELVRRCSDILRFLAIQQMLPHACIELIWNASVVCDNFPHVMTA